MNAGPIIRLHTSDDFLGNIVHWSWITILRNGQFRPHEIINALAENKLPYWYEEKVRNKGQPLCYYSQALVKGGYFKDINWDRMRHQQLKLSDEGLRFWCITTNFRDKTIHKSYLRLNR